MADVSNMAHDIAEYLEDQSVGTVGTNIFVGKQPPTPDLCMTLYNYAGQPPDKVADAFETPGLQVRVRGADYNEAWQKCSEILATLHNLTTSTIETKSYYYIYALGSPTQMGFDKLERPLFTLNFSVMKQFDE